MSYASQADLETRLNVTFTANPDPAVEDWLEEATKEIDKYCRRDFTQHTDDIEYHDGKGQWGVLNNKAHMHTAITLRNDPVISVSEVVNNETTLTEGEDYEVYLETAQIKLHPDRYFAKKLKGVKVTYTWGYATVPVDIRGVCAELVAIQFRKQLQFAEFGVSRSISLEGESMGTPEFGEMPLELAQKLQPYMKWGF